ncbi:MAG: DUF4838 domain-containing protein [Kiritimatiellia bacterium]
MKHIRKPSRPARPFTFYTRWLAITLALSIPVTSMGLTVTRDGVADAVIVANGHTEQARILQDYLRQITGAELPIIEKTTGNDGEIVLDVVDTLKGTSEKPTADQAYRIRSQDEKLSITGASELALRYGVYGFLDEHLGVRFLTPTFDHVPQHKTLVVDDIDDLQEPAFQFRGYIYWPNRDDATKEWMYKQRGGGLPENSRTAKHNFYKFAPPEKFFKTHPEWYPLQADGTRKPDWAFGLCATNEQLARQFANHFVEMIEKHPETDVFPAAQGDGFSPCLCESCRDLVRKEGSETAPYVLLLNRTLELTAEKYPNKGLITFAYFDTLPPPETIKPHDNLWMNVVSSALSQNQAGDQLNLIEGNPANRDYERAIIEWNRVAPGRVTIYHWDGLDPGNGEYGEWPTLFPHCENIRFMHRHGVSGLHIASRTNNFNWSWLYNFVWHRLLWNPEADEEVATREFLRTYYGEKAAPVLWEYLTYVDAVRKESGYGAATVRWQSWPQISRQKLFPPRIADKMRALFERAEALAATESNPVYLEHVQEAYATSVAEVLVGHADDQSDRLAPVKDPESGEWWMVHGGDPGAVKPLRHLLGQVMAYDRGPGTIYKRKNGGPLERLQTKRFTADIVPNLAGQITSLVYAPGKTDVFNAIDNKMGYEDVFPGTYGQYYSVLQATPDKVVTNVGLQPGRWDWPRGELTRTVSFDETGETLIIGREFKQKGGKRASYLERPRSFSTHWRLDMPDHMTAEVVMVKAGTEKRITFSDITLGSIRGAKDAAVGERAPGGDNQESAFEDVLAVSTTEETVVPIDLREGDLEIRFNRGDGLQTRILTTVDGFEAVAFKPLLREKTLLIKLQAISQPVSQEETAIILPTQSVRVEAIAKNPGFNPDRELEPEAVRQSPQIRLTGEGTAVNERDGSELVWIPAGEFLRGSEPGVGGSDEWPRRAIQLDGYWIAKYPVTLGQFKKYIEATGQEMPVMPWGQGMMLDPIASEDEYPALMSWYEAEEYAKWAGAHLPTEAQWEKAARGTEGREYPWGDTWIPGNAVGLERTKYQFQTGMYPVGSSPKGVSPYGVEDMAGNVWEWVADWYAHDYYETSPLTNPAGPASGQMKVLRGGDSSWDESYHRSATRFINPPQVRDWVKTGFRYVIRDDSAK